MFKRNYIAYWESRARQYRHPPVLAFKLVPCIPSCPFLNAQSQECCCISMIKYRCYNQAHEEPSTTKFFNLSGLVDAIVLPHYNIYFSNIEAFPLKLGLGMDYKALSSLFAWRLRVPTQIQKFPSLVKCKLYLHFKKETTLRGG